MRYCRHLDQASFVLDKDTVHSSFARKASSATVVLKQQYTYCNLLADKLSMCTKAAVRTGVGGAAGYRQ